MSEHTDPKMETWPRPKTDAPNSSLSTLLLIFAGIAFIAALILWGKGEELNSVIGCFAGGFQLLITAYVIQALKSMEFYLKGIYEK
tara:strand:- start:117 stop:374 length:258 start_codon:yes stop_codon:yes gene_type:complete